MDLLNQNQIHPYLYKISCPVESLELYHLVRLIQLFLNYENHYTCGADIHILSIHYTDNQ